MTKEPILVLGAKGKIGRRVAARLRLGGVPVRGASRSSAVSFDWDDPATWSDALVGISTAYVMAPTVPGPVHEFLAAGAAAGLRRVVLLSGPRAETWGESAFGLEMIDAEHAVRQSELDWTIVRASNFNQNFDEDLFHPALLAGELRLPAGAMPEPFIDAEDVAEVVIAALLGPGHEGQTYEATGPRSITFAEAVDMIASASDRPIIYRQVSNAEYVSDLVGEGWDRAAAEYVAAMFDLMERGLFNQVTGAVESVLQRPGRSFEDYVARVAARGGWQP